MSFDLVIVFLLLLMLMLFHLISEGSSEVFVWNVVEMYATIYLKNVDLKRPS